VPAAPLLTVVVAGSRAGGPAAAFFDVLAADLARGDVEVVLATARADAGVAPPAGVRVLRLPVGTSVPRLRAAGFRAARAPLVALTEDFCVPTAGWVAALRAAHAAGVVAAVGGPIRRFHGRAVDWALTFCEYGRFFAAGVAGPVHELPGANVCYAAARLTAALGGIPDDFQEVEVHARLLRAGEVLLWQPAAVVHDVNERPFLGASAGMFHHGRLFGGRRVAGAGAVARLKRVVLAPLVPLVLGVRIARGALRSGHAGPLLRSLPFTGVLLVAWAVGEACGSLFGEGRSASRWT
jgi:hypothetical protein